MGWETRTPAGTWRANWRDPSGQQRSKTFSTRRAAREHIAAMESAKTQGSYVDPAAGKRRFGPYARDWFAGQSHEMTTIARDRSILDHHVIARWGRWPLGAITFSDLQRWVSELGKHLAPATVAQCHRLTRAVLEAAVRDRLIRHNPAEGVKLPRARKRDIDFRVISRDDLLTKLLPAVPERYRILPALAAGAGLRWGECIGLRWDSVNLDAGTLDVGRVLIEVGGRVTEKPYPKTAAGRRTVPLAPFLSALLLDLAKSTDHRPHDPVAVGPAGGNLLRGNFRRRIWIPALVDAGLLPGLSVHVDGDGRHVATWVDKDGQVQRRTLRTRRAAYSTLGTHLPPGAPRFHDLRHSYATWLISAGVPINDVAAILGHTKPTTTLSIYVHHTEDRFQRVREALADFVLTSEPDEDDKSGCVDGT